MFIDARKETFDLIQLDGVTCLFTNLRVKRETVPNGLYCYDIRDSDDLDGSFAEVNDFVLVNHWGTILSKVEFPKNEFHCYYPQDTDAVFLDRTMGAEEFLLNREPELSLHSFYIGNVKVYTENGQKYCQLPDEDTPRPYRERICDIEAGDTFLAWGSIRTAERTAHQNYDEPDTPWIVYDTRVDCWFEEDISSNPLSSSYYRTMKAAEKGGSEKLSLDEQVQDAADRADNQERDGNHSKNSEHEH